jgi:hypothetical protein
MNWRDLKGWYLKEKSRWVYFSVLVYKRDKMGKHSERKKFREILGRVLGQLEHRDGMTKAAVFYFLRKTKAAVVWLFFYRNPSL